MEEYLRRSQAFQKRLGINPLPRQEARFLLFRMGGPLMQARFCRLLDLSKVPKTFLHGNPHLDNYVRTAQGSAMMDFDRSRIGPYCWDIIRFLSGLSLKREEEDDFLDRKVVEAFIDSYITYFTNPELPYKQVKLLKSIEPQKWQQSGRDYLKANKKWAKKMREFPLSPQNEVARSILKLFLESRNEIHLLDEFRVDEVGLTPGTLGKKHYIYSLLPKNPDSHKDAIVLDIKEVYEEKDNNFFHNPYPHHGLRMIEASKIFADGMEERLGYCSYQNKQYWGRQIPYFAVKIKKSLSKTEQMDVAFCVASELGKGHRKGLINSEAAGLIERDLLMNFDSYYKISKFLSYELSLAFEAMQRKIKLYQDFRSW